MNDMVIVYLDSNDPLNDKMSSVGFNILTELILEYETYRKLGKTGYYYRKDKANNAPGQQIHFHIYTDRYGKHQIAAINIDGTAHDGSHFVIPEFMVESLRQLGVTIPADRIVECKDHSEFGDRRMLLCD